MIVMYVHLQPWKFRSDDERRQRYALATAHVFLALTRIIIALIRLRNTPPGPIAYLSDIGVPLNRAKDLIYITNVCCSSESPLIF